MKTSWAFAGLGQKVIRLVLRDGEPSEGKKASPVHGQRRRHLCRSRSRRSSGSGRIPSKCSRGSRSSCASPHSPGKLTVNYHGAETSFLEAVFARGDRKLNAVILEAHKRGMRFDGWADCFDFDAWMQVFKDLGIDPAFYASNRQRSFDEVFPRDHLDYGIKKEFLIEECKRAVRGPRRRRTAAKNALPAVQPALKEVFALRKDVRVLVFQNRHGTVHFAP